MKSIISKCVSVLLILLLTTLFTINIDLFYTLAQQNNNETFYDSFIHLYEYNMLLRVQLAKLLK
jgi:ABC-type polysaccharide transport system permease subunit